MRKTRLLLIDDEVLFTRTLKAYLEGTGSCEVRTETHGKAALSYATAHPVDLAILDVNLPDINGYEVTRELRSLYHAWALPILMLTVNDRPVDQLRGLAHGADVYITKPFDSTELFQAVDLLTGGAKPVPGAEPEAELS